MVWTIKRIDEADYGCEERMPGEPEMLLVTLEGDDYSVYKLEVPERWIELQGLEEGDEWPEDISEEDENDRKALKQAEWMERFLDAMDEL